MEQEELEERKEETGALRVCLRCWSSWRSGRGPMRGALRIGLWGSRPRTWKREREKGKEREREGDGEIVEEKKLCKQKLFSLILKRKKLLFCFCFYIRFFFLQLVDLCSTNRSDDA